MKKLLITLGIISLLSSPVMARGNNAYSQGYHNGYESGYDAGKDDAKDDAIRTVFITGFIIFAVVAIYNAVTDKN